MSHSIFQVMFVGAFHELLKKYSIKEGENYLEVQTPEIAKNVYIKIVHIEYAFVKNKILVYYFDYDICSTDNDHTTNFTLKHGDVIDKVKYKLQDWFNDVYDSFKEYPFKWQKFSWVK